MNMEWLASEAKQIHGVFSGLFYSLVLLFLALGAVLSFFKTPLGQVPEILHLVGRAVVAALILAAFPEIMNTAADVTDQLSKEIGQLNNFKLVVRRLGEKLGSFSWSWVSVKDSVLILVSYLSFFMLYVTVYLADTLFLLTWLLLYVFSPLMIAGFVLPGTAQATRGLFQAMLEVCLWKIVWSCLAALLWSYALSEINKPEYKIDFLTAILLNVLLAFSVVITPLIVKGLLSGGMHVGSTALGSAVLGAAALTPAGLSALPKRTVMRTLTRFWSEQSREVSKNRMTERGSPKSRT